MNRVTVPAVHQTIICTMPLSLRGQTARIQIYGFFICYQHSFDFFSDNSYTLVCYHTSILSIRLEQYAPYSHTILGMVHESSDELWAVAHMETEVRVEHPHCLRPRFARGCSRSRPLWCRSCCKLAFCHSELAFFRRKGRCRCYVEAPYAASRAANCMPPRNKRAQSGEIFAGEECFC